MKSLVALAIALLTQGCALTPEQQSNMAAAFRAQQAYQNSPAALQQRQHQHEMYQMQMQQIVRAQPAIVRVQTSCTAFGGTVYCN